jgi:HD superfamily phosphohydrolase YqeK
MEELKNSYLFVADSIEMRKRFKVNSILQELGYSLEKSYNVSLEDGSVEEIKQEEVKEETKKEKSK